MKRGRDDSEEVMRAVQLVCERSVPRIQLDGISLTPLEKQVVAMKQSLAPHVMLLVACGYRVRLFGRDSHVISRRCGIMCIPGQPFEYSSIPYTRVNVYAHRLVSMGYHVAFADQESAAVRAASGTKSGIFTRAVSRWFSRATLLPSERLHTNGDVASAASKTTAPSAPIEKGGGRGTKKKDNDDDDDGGDDEDEHDTRGGDDDGDDAVGEPGDGAHGEGAGMAHARTSFSSAPRAVDASELFMCFIYLPITPASSASNTSSADVAAAATSKRTAHKIDEEAEHDVDEVVVIEDVEDVEAEPSKLLVSGAWEVRLVSFVTQRRVVLTLNTALDLEDMLHRYDIAELVFVTPRVAGSANTTLSSTTGPALTYVNPTTVLAVVPETMLRVLRATLSLHLGPTINGEEDAKSVSVCACVLPLSSSLARQQTASSALDHVVTQYLRPYQLDAVYARLVKREETSLGDANATSSAGASTVMPSSASITKAHPMLLSGATLRALDVFHSSIGPTGSLFHLLDHSLTACGGRKLKTWLAAPLCQVDAIHERQACVSYLLHGLDGGFVEDVLRECSRIGDVEATVGKLFAQRCTVPEYLRLLRTTRAVHLLATEMVSGGGGGGGGDDANSSAGGPPLLLRRLLDDVCASSAAAFMAKHAWEMESECQTPLDLLSGLQTRRQVGRATEPVPSGSPSRGEGEVATLSSSLASMETLLAERAAALAVLEEELEAARRTLKMPGLQFQTIAGTAFLLDLPKAKADHVPSDWLVISRTKSNVRFHTPRILDGNVRLCAANERLVGEAAAGWQALQLTLSESSVDMHVLSTVVELVGTLDALRSLALTSRTSGYVKPTILAHPNTGEKDSTEAGPACVEVSSGCGVHIEDGRHPVLDALLNHQYVACNVTIAAGHTWLLTGPNMGGKSALMRMVGTFVVLAQLGCYVPAAAATLPVFSGVHCRMGASDAILEGSSTFLMEMEETRRILEAPHLPSALVLMDELGRGTSSFDGAAVASATLDYLVKHRCTSMFVTHYSFLCDPWLRRAARDEAAGRAAAVNCFFMGFRRPSEAELAAAEANPSTQGMPRRALVFTYKPCPGVTPSSFGVDVACMAGLPETVLTLAKTMSEQSEAALQLRLDLAELHGFLVPARAPTA